MQALPVCWLNGTVLPAQEASISVFDHGLLYGDGVFEGIRFYRHRPFRLQAHLQRLEDSARAIALPLPYSREKISTAVAETISAFGAENGYLRLVLTRGTGLLGIDPRSCTQPTLFILADHLSMVSPRARQAGAKLIIAHTRRLPPDGLDPRIKSLNYLNSILARMEANHAGADEALMLNAAGRVAEGTADNVFIVRGQILLTPPAIEGALAGITREVVCELAKDMSLPCRETPLSPYDLYTAEECFLTGTGAELIPVAEIDGRKMTHCPGPVFSELLRRFQARVSQASED